MGLVFELNPTSELEVAPVSGGGDVDSKFDWKLEGDRFHFAL